MTDQESAVEEQESQEQEQKDAVEEEETGFNNLLGSVHVGRKQMPPRIVLYSEHGLGKSTFGSQAPKPIFIPTEDGLDNIDCASFPLAQSYDDVENYIVALYQGDHDYETVVVDTADWLESLIWKRACKDANVASIEDFGFGKGYKAAVGYWLSLLEGLNALREDRGMIIIITAHTQIRRFDDPTSEPYDRFTMKLHDRAAAIISEWADVVAFASQELIVKKTDVGFGKKTSRAVGSGRNVMHLNRRPAFDAKNRYSITKTIPLDWAAFEKALNESRG